jgi:L-serine/L-threonine ammonia-lyase
MSLFIKTPVFESMLLNSTLNKNVLFKMECFQPTGTFKIRGIGNLSEREIRTGKSCLVSSSGGNAGYAVAYAGRMMKIDVKVIVPETTSDDVQSLIKNQKAEVIVHGKVWDESHKKAIRVAKSVNGAYIPPFDHPLIWNGHSTMVDEMAQQEIKPPDVIILSVGGGGLFCGIMEGVIRNRWTHTQIITVETEGTGSLYHSKQEGKRITLPEVSGIATSLGAKTIGLKAFEYAMDKRVTPVLVSDSDCIKAIDCFAHEFRVLVEPACGASLALPYLKPDLLSQYENIMVIVCGGIGMNPSILNQFKHQYC